MKAARAVLRGDRRSNPPVLPDWAARLGRTGQQGRLALELQLAATEADKALSGDGTPDRLAVMLAMRARNAIRSLAQDLPSPMPGLPAWATASIAAEHIDLVIAYAAANTWPDRQAALKVNRELFTSCGFQAALAALTELYPADPTFSQLQALIDEINGAGIETVFARHHADHDRRVLLNAWLSSPTWAESQAFLGAHREALLNDQVIEQLARSDDATSRQRLAILLLSTVMPDDQVYALAVDSSQAEVTALDAIEAGDLMLLGAILAAAPDLADRAVTWNVAVAVIHLAQGKQQQARALTQATAEQATPIQRRAYTIRLRALHAKQPNLPGLDDLIAIMQPPTTA